MTKELKQATFDPEIGAINDVVNAIKNLDPESQQNVIDYVVRRFKLQSSPREEPFEPAAPPRGDQRQAAADHETPTTLERTSSDDELEGVSPVARRWMSRSGLSAVDLSKLFSLGIDEIDLVAKEVPGRGKKERMKNVMFLKGIAAYLGSGVARIAHDQLKETCSHYDAFDPNNFAKFLKELSAEIGGAKETGYVLTARGLTGATELVKELISARAK